MITHKSMEHILCLSISAICSLLTRVQAKTVTVATNEQAEEAVSAARPGDTVLLKDGRYRDQVLHMENSGTAEKKITVAAENPGKAIICGKGIVATILGTTISAASSAQRLKVRWRNSSGIRYGSTKPLTECTCWRGMTLR